MADVEIARTGTDEAVAGLAVAPHRGVGAARRALVGRVGEGDVPREESAFVDGSVLSCVDGDHFGRRADDDVLAAGAGIGAVFVAQADHDGLGAGRRIGMGDDAAHRQRRCRVDVGCRAVAPVDGVLVHRVGAGVARVVEVERVDQALFNGIVAAHRDRRRHVSDGHREAGAFHAVRLALLVVDGHLHGIGSVVGVNVLDLRCG